MHENNIIIRLIDSCVPASIKNNHKQTPEEWVRVRAMVAILAVSVLLPLLLLLVYTILQLATVNNFSKNIYILITTEVFVTSQLVYFQSYGNLRFTAGAYSVQYLLVIVATILFSGGWSSPVTILLLCSPMIAFMTISYRAALLHILLVLLITTTLLAMHLQGVHFMNVSEVANYPYTQMVAWGMTLLVFTLFLFIFEHLIRSR